VEARDRVVELRRVKARDLVPAPMNWRQHPDSQRDALSAVLREVGIVDGLKAWERPDGRLELVDGHLRAETLPDQEVPVLVLNLTQDEAAKVLATYDPLGAMAQVDEDRYRLLVTMVEFGEQSLEDLTKQLVSFEALAHPPDDFPDIDEDLETAHECPRCGYSWSGSPAPNRPPEG
jgi:ParB-like chromosome segregation protein Spo0J